VRAHTCLLDVYLDAGWMGQTGQQVLPFRTAFGTSPLLMLSAYSAVVTFRSHSGHVGASDPTHPLIGIPTKASALAHTGIQRA
jgi:hypothetical protein